MSSTLVSPLTAGKRQRQRAHSQKACAVQHADDLRDDGELLLRHIEPQVECLDHFAPDLLSGVACDVGIWFCKRLNGCEYEMIGTTVADRPTCSSSSDHVGEAASFSSMLEYSSIVRDEQTEC